MWWTNTQYAVLGCGTFPPGWSNGQRKCSVLGWKISKSVHRHVQYAAKIRVWAAISWHGIMVISFFDQIMNSHEAPEHVKLQFYASTCSSWFVNKHTMIYARRGHATHIEHYVGLLPRNLWATYDLWSVCWLPGIWEDLAIQQSGHYSLQLLFLGIYERKAFPKRDSLINGP